MAILLALFGFSHPQPSRSVHAYRLAMRESGDLVAKLRGQSAEPAHAVICEIWEHRDDPRFLATVYEAASEAGTPKAAWG